MAATIPAALRSADIARFALRAGQVEKAKPAVAYWCNYWIVNQILSKGLHNSDDESMTYTMHLMDKLEQTKSDHQENDAIVDDLAGQAYVEQFGTEILSRAENAVKHNKATRQTAENFLVSSTFLELCQIWGPLDPEVAAKIKYAKYHSLRITRAIKAGEDPNLSNPAPIQSPTVAESSLELDHPDFHALNESRVPGPARSTAYQPSVEEVSDEHDQLEPKRAERSLTDQSSPLSSAPLTSRELSQGASRQYKTPSLEESENYYNNYGHEEGAPRPAELGNNPPDEAGYFPPIPKPEPIDHPSTLPEIPSDDPGSLPPADTPFSSSMDNPSHNSSSFAHAPDTHRTNSLQSFPPPNTDQRPPPNNPPPPFPSYPSQPPHAPRNAPRPIQPPPQHAQPRPRGNIPPHPPPFAPPAPTPQAPYHSDEEAILKAQKHARWAISALNFEDVNTAVKELGYALESLGAR